MKLLTLNTHSIIEPDYENKLNCFVRKIIQVKPDIIALQEVNQTNSSDNHARRACKLLKDAGIEYNCYWIPIKCGYGKFDEGIAILSLSPALETKEILLSKYDNYNDWRTRKAIGIKIENEWFYSVHFGWWEDADSPFVDQWNQFEEALNKDAHIWAMGDFNSPADIKNEGYDYVIQNGWYDTYTLAKIKDDGYSVKGAIAGWSENSSDKRIDYIFSNRRCDVISSEVIFNGKNGEIVSDHFGILVCI